MGSICGVAAGITNTQRVLGLCFPVAVAGGGLPPSSRAGRLSLGVEVAVIS